VGRDIQIGMLALMLDEYDKSFPDLKMERAEFARQLACELQPAVTVDFREVADTREKVEEQVRLFEANDYDGILVVFLTYAPSLIAAPVLARSRLPVVVWNTQPAWRIPVGALDDVIMDNHGVHGVQDLMNVLSRAQKDALVVTAHHEDELNMNRLRTALRAMGAASVLRRARIGLVGYSMQDMGDFNIDETSFLHQVGPAVIHIPVDELADLVENAPGSAVENIVAQYRRDYVWDPAITDEECRLAACMEWAVRQLIARYRLDGWAQHFISLGNSPRIRMLPFLAASKLMAGGIAYGAEGDVTAAASFLLVQAVAGEAGFSEMFCMDFDDGALLMRHMGEGNIALAREDSQIRIVRNRFGMVDVLPVPSPVFSVRTGEATLVSVTAAGEGRFKLVVAEGEVTDFPGREHATSPECKWRPAIPLERFLEAYAYAGGSHHQALGYGRLGDAVADVAKLMGLEVIRVC